MDMYDDIRIFSLDGLYSRVIKSYPPAKCINSQGVEVLYFINVETNNTITFPADEYDWEYVN